LKYEYVIILTTISIFILGIALHPAPKERFTILHFTEPMSLQEIIKINQPFYVNFTVINHEYADHEYRYEILLGDKKIKEGTIALSHNESKEVSETIIAKEPKNRTMVSIRLYKDGLSTPYRSLRYLVNITEG